jgi:hypothetical protein
MKRRNTGVVSLALLVAAGGSSGAEEKTTGAPLPEAIGKSDAEITTCFGESDEDLTISDADFRWYRKDGCYLEAIYFSDHRAVKVYALNNTLTACRALASKCFGPP